MSKLVIGHSAIDELMERASTALANGDYFECASMCERALVQARRSDDFERMARVCLPLHALLTFGICMIVSTLKNV